MPLPDLTTLAISTPKQPRPEWRQLMEMKRQTRMLEEGGWEDELERAKERCTEGKNKRLRLGLRSQVDVEPTRMNKVSKPVKILLRELIEKRILCNRGGNRAINEAYSVNLLEDDGAMLWLHRDISTNTYRESDDNFEDPITEDCPRLYTIYGFAIATEITYNNSTILHLQLLCDERGEGQQLFKNVMRYGFNTRKYDFFELDALNGALATKYAGWASTLFGQGSQPKLSLLSVAQNDDGNVDARGLWVLLREQKELLHVEPSKLKLSQWWMDNWMKYDANARLLIEAEGEEYRLYVTLPPEKTLLRVDKTKIGLDKWWMQNSVKYPNVQVESKRIVTKNDLIKIYETMQSQGEESADIVPMHFYYDTLRAERQNEDA